MQYELVCTRGPLKGGRWELTPTGVKIGRSSSCEICVDEPSVASLYCIVKLDGGKPVVQNLASDSGVDVNGIAVEEAELDPMDTIHAGSAKFLLSAPRGGKGGFAKKALALVALLAVAAAGFFAYDRLPWRGLLRDPQAVTNTVVDVLVREVVTTNTVVNIVANVTRHVVEPGPIPSDAKRVPAKDGKGEVVETTDGLILSSDGRTLLFAPRELTSVAIPDCVTAIGDKAFDNHKKLDRVTIPPTVTKFGQFAFRWCDNLTGVFITNLAAWCQLSFEMDNKPYDWDWDSPLWYAHNLYLNGSLVKDMQVPDGVTSVGGHAFRGCTSLTRVRIPRGVSEIAPGAFADCGNLVRFEVEESNRRYKSVDGLLLTNDGRTLVAVPGGLERVEIPASVVSIGDWAFAGCGKLTKLTIPNGVTSIGYWTFKRCKSLASIAIPPSMVKIAHGAFWGCDNLADVYITDIAAWCRMSVSKHSHPLDHAGRLYLDGEQVKDLIIPKDVENIGSYAFYGCSSLLSVIIPRKVERIGVGAFAKCSNLAEFRVAGGNMHYKVEDGFLLTRDGKNLIAAPGGIESVNIPRGVEAIAGSVFNSCSKLSRVSIPRGVTIIGDGAFWNCQNLVSVELSDSLKTIAAFGPFGSCKRLANITIPGSLDNIGGGAFAWSGLTNVTIQPGVKNIGGMAFDGTCLKHIVIPDSVTNIAEKAFADCKELESVTIPAGLTNIHERAFIGCPKLLDAYGKPVLKRVSNR